MICGDAAGLHCGLIVAVCGLGFEVAAAVRDRDFAWMIHDVVGQSRAGVAAGYIASIEPRRLSGRCRGAEVILIGFRDKSIAVVESVQARLGATIELTELRDLRKRGCH